MGGLDTHTHRMTTVTLAAHARQGLNTSLPTPPCSLCDRSSVFTAEEMLFSAHHASYKESLDAGVQCFIMAIDVSYICTVVH